MLLVIYGNVVKGSDIQNMGFFNLFKKKKEKKKKESTVTISFETKCTVKQVPVETSTKAIEDLKDEVRKYNFGESEYYDNLNYMLFSGNAVFSGTGRKRTIKIEAFSEEEARKELIEQGFLADTINIQRIQFERMTENQLAALEEHGDPVPTKSVSKIDASSIITRVIGEEKTADRSLFDFSTAQKVKLSYFAGEESVCNSIWYSFDTNKKVAFYLLCLRKYKYGTWDFDKFDCYLNKAPDLLANQKFFNSFKRYLNAGFKGFDKNTSRDTNCYKIALEEI